MTSSRPFTTERQVDGRVLAPCFLAAAYVNRHPDLVRRRCQHAAVDPVTKAKLYDVEAVAEAFADTPRRVAV